MRDRCRILVLMGPMGCGKTTVGRLLAQKFDWPFIDADDLHPEENVARMRAGFPLTDEDRLPWLELLRGRIDEWIERDRSVVLGCSALKKSYRKILGIDQKTVISVYLKGSYELLRQRIESRQHQYMNKGLLQSQLDTLEEPCDGIVVDIVGDPEDVVDRIIGSLGSISSG